MTQRPEVDLTVGGSTPIPLPVMPESIASYDRRPNRALPDSRGWEIEPIRRR